jgi:3-phosphoshikimate 1-carboxyvinyltransferase
LPTKFNAGAIDEFLVIFLVAAKAKGISFFKNLSELKSKRKSKIRMGIKNFKFNGY